MGAVVSARPKTFGPMSTPSTSSSTTSGTSLPGSRPAMSGASTEQSTIQNREESVAFIARLPPGQRRPAPVGALMRAGHSRQHVHRSREHEAEDRQRGKGL